MGKVIVITGANGGLGRALARRFAREGEQVVLLGRSLAKVQAIADEIGSAAFPVACDVSSPASVREAFAAVGARHGRIDVLINNAALFEPIPIEEATDEHILNGVLANLAGPILCARSAIPLLEPGGVIISVSSELVDLPFPHLLVYQSTKAGLEKFTLGLHDELAERGIRACVIRAGQMYGEGMSAEMDPEAGARFFEAAAKRGLNLVERGFTTYESATQAFRNVIDLPADMHADLISFHARPAAARGS
jgi:meso-butanediol dehydrogenase/(S,S)-butanediol dehydrogenase/diacetyl reductase